MPAFYGNIYVCNLDRQGRERQNQTTPSIKKNFKYVIDIIYIIFL